MVIFAFCFLMPSSLLDIINRVRVCNNQPVLPELRRQNCLLEESGFELIDLVELVVVQLEARMYVDMFMNGLAHIMRERGVLGN
jgi:hypothetical protein